MAKYIHGWGICRTCGRAFASTSKGFAWRHGSRKTPCGGSGRLLLNRKKVHRWTAFSV